MKFRIKHIEGVGYWGQVLHSGITGGWKTIGKHPNGYGLYPVDHKEYPLETEEKAIECCKSYKVWKEDMKRPATFTDISID